MGPQYGELGEPDESWIWAWPQRFTLRQRLRLLLRCGHIVAHDRTPEGMNLWICHRWRFHLGPHRERSCEGAS